MVSNKKAKKELSAEVLYIIVNKLESILHGNFYKINDLRT